MFKIVAPITKSFESADGKTLYIKGIASSPAVDREYERFSPEAIQKMSKELTGGNLPIRLEHEAKVYTDIGVWKSASVDENNLLVVEGELDLEFSLAKDIAYMLKKGQVLSLSVGGMVNEVGFEYEQELQRSIKVYKDISLEEISIVKNPANFDTSLTLSKSVDWDAVEKSGSKKMRYTTQAQKAIALYKSMEKVERAEFKAKGLGASALKGRFSDKPDSWKKEKMTKMVEWSRGVEKTLKEAVEKCELCWDEDYDDYGSAATTPSMTMEDMMLVATLSRVLSEVELPDDTEVNEMMASEMYWEIADNVGEDGFVILSDRYMVLPHHNLDYTVNKELVLYQLKMLIDNSKYWLPSDYKVAFNHLYNHLQELQIIKSIDEKRMLTKEQIVQLYGAFRFSKSLSTDRPMTEGRAMTDEEVAAAADAFTKVADNAQVLEVLKDMEAAEAAPAPEATPAPVETVPEAGGEAVPEVVPTPEVTPEVPGGEAPAPEATPAPEEVPAPAPEPEVVPEVAPEATPAPEAAPVEEVAKALSVQKATIEKSVNEAVAKATSTLVGQLAAVTKSLKEANDRLEVVKTMEAEFADVKEIVEALGKQPFARKSIASFQALEKTMKEGSSTEGKTVVEVATAMMEADKTLSFSKAYAKAKTELLSA